MHSMTPAAVLVLAILFAACRPDTKDSPDTAAPGASGNRVTIKAKCESEGMIDFSIKPFKASLNLSNQETMTWRQNGNDDADVAMYAKPGSPWPFDDDTLKLTRDNNGTLTVPPKAGTTAGTVKYVIRFMCPGANGGTDTLIVDPDIIISGIGLNSGDGQPDTSQ